MFEAI